ncbi:CIR protein, fragment [Plasmodium vinckei vinckei]|uniref:CIR protein n=1 Tax=Plasmodium vinckei vinckei TaxID=54757 RepID=A0A081I991_PLAVN|nr:CIR protein, fragment [Plasmodium vinckei vinckei]KEG00249.1 hypothetical protein YYE_04760 [Plasmodium vinckei vinckei]VEV54403.1 CIR protein, fragment [Plasmodium vinckei vinckei]
MNMCEFYTVFNHICNTIADYKTNNAKGNIFSQKSGNRLNKHISRYENIYKCNPNLHLLDKLKKIYVDFRGSVIKKETGNNNLYQQIQKRATENKRDSYFAKSFEAFYFNNLKCKPKNKVNIPSDKNKTQETKAIISKNTNKLEYPL